MAMAMERRVRRRLDWLRGVKFVKRSRVQAIGIIVVAVVVSAFCVQNGIAAYAREDSPELTLAVAPSDARAMSAWAGQIQLILGRINDPEAIALARAALRRDTTLATPYRVLGLAREAVGDLSGADRFVGFASKLSRRDVATQLWLINRAVDRNDVSDAVGHFDTALRTSDAATDILFPILVNALSEPEVVDAVAPRLLTAPWAQDFIAKAIDTGSSMPGILALAEAMNRERRPFSPDTMRQLANRLVETKSYALLPRFRAISTARSVDRQAVADSMFNRPVEVPSFDWAFDEAGRANVIRVSDSGQGSGMSFELIEAAAATQVARQL